MSGTQSRVLSASSDARAAVAAITAAACPRGVLSLGVNPGTVGEGLVDAINILAYQSVFGPLPRGESAYYAALAKRLGDAVQELRSSTVNGVYTVRDDTPNSALLIAVALRIPEESAAELLDEMELALLQGQDVYVDSGGSVTAVTRPITTPSVGQVSLELTLRLSGNPDLDWLDGEALALPLGFRYRVTVTRDAEKGLTRIIFQIWDDQAPVVDRTLVCSARGVQPKKVSECFDCLRQSGHSCELCASQWKARLWVEQLLEFIEGVPVDKIVRTTLETCNKHNPGTRCAGHPSGRVVERDAPAQHAWDLHDALRAELALPVGEKWKYPIPAGFDQKKRGSRGGRGGRGSRGAR